MLTFRSDADGEDGVTKRPAATLWQHAAGESGP